MATLTIKNFPDGIYKRLAASAKTNRRSLNSEAIVRLERAVALEKPINEVEEGIARVRKMREELRESGVWLTDEILYTAKNEGRP